jgi:hypothetical protein
MIRSVTHGKILVLSKDAINKMFMNENECSYEIAQIELGFDDNYIVEVVEKRPGITMVPVSNINKIFKNMSDDKE